METTVRILQDHVDEYLQLRARHAGVEAVKSAWSRVRAACQLELRGPEIRVARAGGVTVTLQYVLGGSFARVDVRRDATDELLLSLGGTFQYTTQALESFYRAVHLITR